MIPRRAMLAAGPALLAGCSRAEENYYGRTEAPGTQRLSFVIAGEPATLDPAQSIDRFESYIISAMFEGLISLHPVTGEPLVALQAPDSDIINLIGFNADGSQLVVATSGISRNQVWDLRRIRAQITVMGLDWDRPPLAPPIENLRPAQVQVDLGELTAKLPK